MADKQMTLEQKVPASALFKSDSGAAAPVDGLPVWMSDNEAVAKVVPSADGMSADVVAVGVGTATITVDGDADLGSGVVHVTASKTVEVVPPMASTVDLQFGEAVPQ